MNVVLKVAVTLAMTAATATAANAALVTKTYSVTSAFDRGPNASIIQNFTLTFDPDAATDVKMSDYTSSVDNVTAKLADPYRKYYDAYYFGVNLPINEVGLFYTVNGTDVSGVDAGYILNLTIDTQGNPLGSYLNYSDGRGYFSSAASTASLVTTPGTGPGTGGPAPDAPVAGAVPEPATWAMMILGFGVVGGAMRRRPKLTLRTA